MDARPLLVEITDLKRALADARRAVAYQRQRADQAERQIAALLEAEQRAWRIGLQLSHTERRPRPTEEGS
jgi:hypothetical protein